MSQGIQVLGCRPLRSKSRLVWDTPPPNPLLSLEAFRPGVIVIPTMGYIAIPKWVYQIGGMGLSFTVSSALGSCDFWCTWEA